MNDVRNNDDFLLCRES